MGSEVASKQAKHCVGFFLFWSSRCASAWFHQYDMKYRYVEYNSCFAKYKLKLIQNDFFSRPPSFSGADQKPAQAI